MVDEFLQFNHVHTIMSEQEQRVITPCPSPSCSATGEVMHEIVKRRADQFTVTCTACGHTHKTNPPSTQYVERDVIVSHDGDSFATTIEAPLHESVQVGEEFIIDNDDILMAVRITDLELGPEHRATNATIEDVSTFWTRAVDNVYVNVTLHPADGKRQDSQSIEMGVPGDYEFEVGSREAHGDITMQINGLVIRDDAIDYPTTKLDRRGDSAPAKDIKRIYATDTRSTAWSAW